MIIINQSLIQGVQSVDIPAAISFAGTYLYNMRPYKPLISAIKPYGEDAIMRASNYFLDTKYQIKTQKNLHLKTAQAFTSAVAADHLCSPFKSNFISNEICNMAVKNAMSYGVQSIYNNVNNMLITKNEVDNQESKLSLGDDLDSHHIQDITSFSQA